MCRIIGGGGEGGLGSQNLPSALELTMQIG